MKPLDQALPEEFQKSREEIHHLKNMLEAFFTSKVLDFDWIIENFWSKKRFKQLDEI